MQRCSAALPIEPSWMKLRGHLIDGERRMTLPAFEMMGEALRAEGDIWAGYRKNRADWFPEDLKAKHGPGRTADHVYFAGCTASYVEPDIAIATVRLLDKAGIDFTYLGTKESCCAVSHARRGQVGSVRRDDEEEHPGRQGQRSRHGGRLLPGVRHDVAAGVSAVGEDARHRVRPDGPALQRAALEEDQGRGIRVSGHAGRAPRTVTWHDSCHLGRASNVYDPPRDLIKAVPNVTLVEMSHNREEGHCCGSVVSMVADPAVAIEAGSVRLEEAVATGADTMLALCPCCEFQLRVTRDARKLPIEITDLAHFAADALGVELPDPHPEVTYQWALFEKIIALMTPQGFAALMKTMWPELVAAMPMGMGAMMRGMGKVPGALEAMRPLFPTLFPLLLPGMMKKVMPAMLARIQAQVPMPAYMAEQMPAMMPRVMDTLMPHMIGDVIPLVSDSLIAHLRGRPAAM